MIMLMIGRCCELAHGWGGGQQTAVPNHGANAVSGAKASRASSRTLVACEYSPIYALAP